MREIAPLRSAPVAMTGFSEASLASRLRLRHLQHYLRHGRRFMTLNSSMLVEPRIERGRDGWPWTLWILILWAGFVVASITACGAGFLRPEAFTFLPHYLQDRPWYEIIYDTGGTDMATYQARELGHALTFLDSHFILWSVLAGHPHFFSVSHYLLLLACGYLLWQIGSRSLKLPAPVTAGLILLLWTSPTAFLFSSYYRGGKIGLCCGTLLLAAVWLSYQHTPEVAKRRERQLLAWLGIAALLLPMFDKQGLVFLIGAAAFCAQRALVTEGPKDRAALVTIGGALLVALIYGRFIGPQLTQKVGHAEPNLIYQSLPIFDFLSNPRHIAVVLFGAPLMAVNSLQFVAGNVSMGVFLAALGGVFWLLLQVKPAGAAPWRTLFRPAHLYLAMLFLVVALFAMLLIRSPHMFTNEHRRFFYGAPLSAVWLVGLAVLAALCQERWPHRRDWLTFAIAVLVVGNVFALLEHRFILRQGEYAGYRQSARRLTYALAPERILRQGVDPAEAEALLAKAPRAFKVAPRALDSDPIFLVLLSRYWARSQADAAGAR